MIPSQRLKLAVAGSAAALAILYAVAAVFQAQSVPDRTALAVMGRPYFLAGVNYPWKTYQDFGTGGWGYSGVAHPTTRAEIEADFANLAAQGVRVVKWRVFNDGRYSPEFDEAGFVTGLDEEFFADVDAALALARQYDIYLVLGLFASGLWTSACVQEDVQLGGRAATLAHPAKRESLLRNAIVPLLQHVGRDDRVIAYEILAEPEWGIRELNRDRDGRTKIPLAAARAFVAAAAGAIHTYTDALATVESNRATHMRYWKGTGLDYYSFSWYDWLEPYEPLDRPAQALGLDGPVVLGEFPVGSSQYYGLAQVLEVARRQGYAGAFAWSYLGGDGYGKWQDSVAEYVEWARPRWDELNLGGTGQLPAGEVALKPQPYDYGDVAVSAAESGVAVAVDVNVRDGGSYVAKFFLQQIGAEPAPLEQSVPVEFAASEPSELAVRFAGLAEQVPYKLSLGLFDASSSQLQKWFDGIALLQVGDGEVREPDLTALQKEDPCYRQ